jgi:hypothetical protein
MVLLQRCQECRRVAEFLTKRRKNLREEIARCRWRCRSSVWCCARVRRVRNNVRRNCRHVLSLHTSADL